MAVIYFTSKNNLLFQNANMNFLNTNIYVFHVTEIRINRPFIIPLKSITGTEHSNYKFSVCRRRCVILNNTFVVENNKLMR